MGSLSGCCVTICLCNILLNFDLLVVLVVCKLIVMYFNKADMTYMYV